MSNLARWKTAEASEMTPIESSYGPVVTDSLCNVEPKSSQVKKRKKKKQKVMQDAKSGYCGDVASISNSSLPGGLCLKSEVYIGTKSDLKSGLPRDSCLESEVDMSTDLDSKKAEASDMNSSLPVVTDSLCNESSQAKRRNKKRQKATQDSQSDPPGDVSSIANSSLPSSLYLESEAYIGTKLDLKPGLPRDSCLESKVDMSTDVGSKTAEASDITPIENSSLPIVTDSLCNESSQAKKRSKKRQKATQDSQSDPPGDISSIANSSLQGGLCHESEVYIGTKSDLKPGLQRDSCLESEVDMSTDVGSKTAEASEITPIKNISQPVVADSLCNGSSQAKKRNKKRQKVIQDAKSGSCGDVSSKANSSLLGDLCLESVVYIGTKSDLKPGLPRDSCLGSVDMSTDVGSKTAEASEMIPIKNSSLPFVTDTLCNESSQAKKRNKKRQKAMQDSQSDPPGDISSVANSSLPSGLYLESEVYIGTKLDLKPGLPRDSCLESEVDMSTDVGSKTAEASDITPIENSSLLIVTDSLCNESSQAKKRSKKREKPTQDSQSDLPGDISSIANSSLQEGLCHESEVYIGTKSDLKPGLQSDSCLESEVDMSTDVASKTAEASEITPIKNISQPVVADSLCTGSSQAKKMNKKRQKVIQDAKSGSCGDVSSKANSSLLGGLGLESEVYIGTESDLKPGLPRDSCLESVDMSADIGSKTAEALEMTPIENSSLPFVTDSLCNESSQAKKRNKKRQKAMQDSQSDPPGDISSVANSSLPSDLYLESEVYIGTKLDLKPGLPRDSCLESEIDMSTDVASKTAEASDITPIENSSLPIVTDSLYNESSQAKKRSKKRQKATQDSQSDPPGDISSIANSSLQGGLCHESEVYIGTKSDLKPGLQRDSCLESEVDMSTDVGSKTAEASEITPIKNISQPVVADSLCNGSSQVKKRNKKRQKVILDAKSGSCGDVSSKANSSLLGGLGLESEVYIGTKSDLKPGLPRDSCLESVDMSTDVGSKTAEASEMTPIDNSSLPFVTDSLCNESSKAKKRNKKRQKAMQDSQSDPPRDISSVANSSLPGGLCLESEVYTGTKSHLKSGLPINSCLESEVDMSTDLGSKNPEASEMTLIVNSSLPVVTDSLCNESSQAKKRNKKRQKVMQDAKSGSCGDVSSIANSSLPGVLCLESEVYIGTKSDLNSGLPRDSCLESEVDMSTDVGSKTVEASDITPIENSSLPVVTNSLCYESSQAKKRNKKRQKATQDSQSDPLGDVLSIANSSLPGGLCLESEVFIGTKSDLKSGLPRDLCIESEVDMSTDVGSKTAEASEMTPTENSSLPVVTDSLCNESSQAKKSNKKRQKVMQDAKSGSCGDISSIANSSLLGGLCLESEVYIGTKSDLKPGLPGDSCLESVDMSTDVGSKTAKASEMTPIESSSLPVVTDSLCNESSQAKKSNKKRQKVMQDAKSGSCGDVSSIANSSLPRGLCLESEVYIGTKLDLKSGQTSEMTTINNTSDPVVTNSSQAEKKKKKKHKRVQDDGKSDPPGEVSSLMNCSLQRDSCSESAVDVSAKVDSETAQASGTSTISTNPPPVVTDYICNVGFKSSETKNRTKKTQTKKKKPKQQGLQDPPLETLGDVSSRKDSTLQKDSPVETAVYTSTKVDLKTSQASETTPVNDSNLPAVLDALCYVESRSSLPKKKKERQKRMQDAQLDPYGDAPSIKNSFLERDLCFESEVSTMKDLEIAQASGMTAINNSSLQVVTDFEHNVKPESSQANKGKKGQKWLQDVLADFSGNISSIKSSSLEINFCLEPEVDCSSKGDFERVQPSMTPISNSSQLVLTEPLDESLQAMKKRKKKKIMQDVKADLPGDISSIKNSSIGGDSCCEPEADICTEADLKTAQSSQISSTQPHRKRKRRKQRKLKAVTVDVCVPLEVASTSLLEANAFRAEQQSGFPGNASASLTRYDKEFAPLQASSTHLMGQNTLSGSSSLMKISDSVSPHDIVSQENEIVQAFQKDDGSLKTYHRKRKSHDALGNSAQPIVQSCDGSANILDVLHEVHISSTKDVQDNLDEKGSSLSNGKVGFEENGKMAVMKINVDSDGPIMEENTPQVPHFSPKGSHTRCSNKKLIILDINGLLADIVPPSRFGRKPDIRISKKSVFKRPFCYDFLQFCLEKFDVGVWSSRTKKNVELVVNYLFGDLKDKLLFCWDQSHCTKTGVRTIENRNKPLVLKELKKIWEHLKTLPGYNGEYDESNTLLLDDSPYKALTNPVHSCLFPRSYSHRAKKDSSIGPGGDLRVYLEQLAEAPNVSEFIAHKPFGQQAISKSSPSWAFYQKILRSLWSCQ